MTHKDINLRPKIALYEPDIPQNTASIIRTCACLGACVEIIEPVLSSNIRVGPPYVTVLPLYKFLSLKLLINCPPLTE